MKVTVRFVAVSSLLAVLINCQGASLKNIIKGIDSPSSSHLYMAGSVGTSTSQRVPVYWKDGVLNYLPLTNSNTTGSGWGIAEDKSGNLYIFGWQNGGPAGDQLGFWKNSTFYQLSLGTYAAGNEQTIAIDTNNNVWLFGNVGASSSTENTYVYWEIPNGETNVSSIAPTVFPGNPAGVASIQADDAGNVYFFGNEQTTIGSYTDWVAYVWKNGGTPVALPLSGGNTFSYAEGSCIDSSGNVYVLGVQWVDTGTSTSNGFVYWENAANPNIPLPLTTYADYDKWPIAIAVSSTGTVNCFAAVGPSTSNWTTLLYWASATSTNTTWALPSGYTNFGSPGNAVLDSKGNFIVPGQVGTAGTNGSILTSGVPCYWENGAVTFLPMGSGNTYGRAGYAVVGP